MNKRKLVVSLLVSSMLLTACGNDSEVTQETTETLGDIISVTNDSVSDTIDDEFADDFLAGSSYEEAIFDDFSEVSEEYARKLISYSPEKFMSELLTDSVLESACNYQPDANYQQYSSKRTNATTYYRLTSDNYFNMEYTLREGSFNLLFEPNSNPTLTDPDAYEAIKRWLQETTVLLLGESVDFNSILTDLENSEWGSHTLSFTVGGEDYSISFRMEENNQGAEIVLNKDNDDVVTTPLSNKEEVSEALGEQNEQVFNALDQIVPILMSQESIVIGKNYTQEDYSFNIFTEFTLESDNSVRENTKVLTLETCEAWPDTRLIVMIRPESVIISVRCKDEEQMSAMQEVVPELIKDDDYTKGLILEIPLGGTNQLILADYL